MGVPRCNNCGKVAYADAICGTRYSIIISQKSFRDKHIVCVVGSFSSALDAALTHVEYIKGNEFDKWVTFDVAIKEIDSGTVKHYQMHCETSYCIEEK